MYFNVITFKGTDKIVGIRTETPLDLEELSKKDFVAIVDASSTEVTQFRPVDVLRLNTVNEANVELKTEITGRAINKKPKGFKIN